SNSRCAWRITGCSAGTWTMSCGWRTCRAWSGAAPPACATTRGRWHTAISAGEMMQQAMHKMLPDGRRLHLQHGPIDLIVEAWGAHENVAASYRQAVDRFETVLTELVGELPRLRAPVDANCRVRGTTARRMWRATA